MIRGYRWVALNAVIILAGGALLTAMNLLPWFAVGLPVVIALGITELSHRTKALTFDERRDARDATAARQATAARATTPPA